MRCVGCSECVFFHELKYYILVQPESKIVGRMLKMARGYEQS